MQFQKIFAVAIAETRSVRRLARTWIFSALSVFITVLAYLYYGVIHGLFSSQSATIGSAGPRFLISAFGIYMLGIFLVGIIFLAFDVRARDQRERMAEVLDSRPISNLELLVGRAIGLTFMAWLPVLIVAVLLQTIGTLARLFGLFMLEPVQPVSLAAFMFVDALTSLALWCSVVILLAVTLRNRLLVTVVSFVLLGLQLWSFLLTPLYLLPSVSTLASFGALASDVLPQFMTAEIAVQRACLWLLIAGFLVLAAGFHPRPDSGSRGRRLAIGATLAAVGFAGIVSLALRAGADKETYDRWAAAHEARQDEARPDLQRVRGRVEIDPGDRLTIDLEMTVTANVGENLDELLFTLNPGMKIESLRVGGSKAAFEHELGLLTIALQQPLPSGSILDLSIQASGEPIAEFAYLDTAKDLLGGTTFDAQIALLGTEPAIFESSYVALMPGVRWMPRPGTSVPSDDSSRRPADFFELDLEVDVPSGWLVAGPGKRHDSGNSEGASFRFRPPAQVPDVALVAARFESRVAEVAGVELELLIHRKHLRNVEFFADAKGALLERIDEIFSEAQKIGIPYPYDGLTVVEIPAQLRSFGGDWRMDTVQALPAIMLLREHSFPTSRFEFPFLNNADTLQNREGGIAAAKVDALENFFVNDFSGGNPFLGVTRNFVLYQTGAKGEGAVALDYVIDELTNQLLHRSGGFFSAHIFDSQMGFIIGSTIINMISGRTDEIADAVLSAAADRPSVWDRALGSPLAKLEVDRDPKQAVNVLALKGRAIAESILDGLGREKTGQLLAKLLRRHRGGNYTAADLEAIATEIDADLETLVGDWLNDATLPGFMPSPVETVRLTDDAQGRPRYQTRLHVRNDEATPGLLTMRYRTDDENDDADWERSDPIRIEGHSSIEVGLLSSAPPLELWLRPYLSLNRQQMRLDLPTVDEEGQSREEPFLGHRPSSWLPSHGEAIVVDDLDPGFSVHTVAAEGSVRLDGSDRASEGGPFGGLFSAETDLDQGLPEYTEFGPPPREWNRRELATGFGKYRRTIALARAGEGDKKAIFAAELPSTGRWRLEYHMPTLSSRSRTASGSGIRLEAAWGMGGSQGSYDMQVEIGSDAREIEFDGSIAEPGWNRLGEFDVSSRDVRVVVSNETSGRTVIADAIRWLPVSAQ